MDFELRYSDKEITAWGGMGLMKRMLDHLKFNQALESAQLPQPCSNRGYSPIQLVMQFMLTVWCGGNRFEHGEVTRYDPVLKRLFGFSRMANFKAIIRFFRRFTRAGNDLTFDYLYAWLFRQLSVNRVTIDLDSTIMTRYGQQEGASKGYNPKKPGRSSHHPLMAFVADTRMIANCWLRPGNSSSANNVCAFLDATLKRLNHKAVGLLRADSGFCEAAFLDKLEDEQHSIQYIIGLRLNQPLQRKLVSADGWWSLDSGIELTSFLYQPPAWSKPRRVVGIRQHIKYKEDAKGKQLSLFADNEFINHYRYAALVTDLGLPDLEVWRTYRGRADCENRIKELKYDFAADSFCMKDFWATEACLNMVMIAYNLMSLFRQVALRASIVHGGKDIQHTLKTLRFKLFAKSGYVGTEGRKQVLKLAIAMQHRQWFEGVWNRSKTFDLPVVFAPAFTP
jgi:virulence-associated protein VapD